MPHPAKQHRGGDATPAPSEALQASTRSAEAAALARKANLKAAGLSVNGNGEPLR